MGAEQVLDEIQSLSRIAAAEANPHAYAERLAPELVDAATREALAARDDRLRDALARIDAMTERAMRIRLEHALADDTAIGIPTRKVFASTVVGYAGKLDVLEARAIDVANRGGSPDPAGAASSVADAARATLELRDAIRRRCARPRPRVSRRPAWRSRITTRAIAGSMTHRAVPGARCAASSPLWPHNPSVWPERRSPRDWRRGPNSSTNPTRRASRRSRT